MYSLIKARLKDRISCTTAPLEGTLQPARCLPEQESNPGSSGDCQPAYCTHSHYHEYCKTIIAQSAIAHVIFHIFVNERSVTFPGNLSALYGRLLWSHSLMIITRQSFHLWYWGRNYEYTNNKIITASTDDWVLFVQYLSFNGGTILLSSAHSI